MNAGSLAVRQLFLPQVDSGNQNSHNRPQRVTRNHVGKVMPSAFYPQITRQRGDRCRTNPDPRFGSAGGVVVGKSLSGKKGIVGGH